MASHCHGLMTAVVLTLGAVTSAYAQGDGTPPEPKPAEEKKAVENSVCLDCHGDTELAPTMTAKSGDKLLLFADEEQLGGSVHAKLNCVDCHVALKDATEDGHGSTKADSKREATVRYSEGCKECHFDKYTKTLDSVHHALIVQGNLSAATCADCHGSHAVKKAAEPRSSVSETCASCHALQAQTFGRSVHGHDPSNPDTPVCTDCHRSHDIADPKTGAWKLSTPQMCGSCHTNEAMMSKYKLSTNVLDTYLADFHGATAVLQKGEKDAQPVVALCTDCHGVHDIQKADAPNSHTVQANLQKTCAKCHEGASVNFPKSWMSHYEPTWEKAPIVWGVKAFYMFLIPFMIGGLVLQIALHLWRVVVNR